MDIIVTLILILISFVVGATIIYYILRPKLNEVKKRNDEIDKQNEELRINNSIYSTRNQQLQQEQTQLLSHLDEINTSIAIAERQAKESADLLYQHNLEIAQQGFEQSLEEERIKYEEAMRNFDAELMSAMNDGAVALATQIKLKNDKIAELDAKFSALLATTEAAVEASKRAAAIQAQADFYKIQLSDIDLQEIEALRSIAPMLRDQEPLNKVIWKVYYEKPTTDLIGRVIGPGTHTGIYKITNLENNMCYVGQAANLADRWRQHIKRGLGADTPTRNKLYPAMQSTGVENFSFEVVEECPREQLDEREDFWQDYFHAKDFGYSIK